MNERDKLLQKEYLKTNSVTTIHNTEETVQKCNEKLVLIPVPTNTRYDVDGKKIIRKGIDMTITLGVRDTG